MKIMLVQWFSVATLTATFQKSDLTNHMLPLVWLHGMVKPIASNFVSENVMYVVLAAIIATWWNVATILALTMHILTFKIAVGLRLRNHER